MTMSGSLVDCSPRRALRQRLVGPAGDGVALAAIVFGAIGAAGGGHSERAEIDKPAAVTCLILTPTRWPANSGKSVTTLGVRGVRCCGVNTSDVSTAMTRTVAESHRAGRRTGGKHHHRRDRENLLPHQNLLCSLTTVEAPLRLRSAAAGCREGWLQ